MPTLAGEGSRPSDRSGGPRAGCEPATDGSRVPRHRGRATHPVAPRPPPPGLGAPGWGHAPLDEASPLHPLLRRFLSCGHSRRWVRGTHQGSRLHRNRCFAEGCLWGRRRHRRRGPPLDQHPLASLPVQGQVQPRYDSIPGGEPRPFVGRRSPVLGLPAPSLLGCRVPPLLACVAPPLGEPTSRPRQPGLGGRDVPDGLDRRMRPSQQLLWSMIPQSM